MAASRNSDVNVSTDVRVIGRRHSVLVYVLHGESVSRAVLSVVLGA